MARLKRGIYLKILEISWHDGYVTCHDGLVNLLPRHINEGIVSRWWAFLKPKFFVYKSQMQPEAWGAILET